MDNKNNLNYLTDHAAKHVTDVHVHHQAPKCLSAKSRTLLQALKWMCTPLSISAGPVCNLGHQPQAYHQITIC